MTEADAERLIESLEKRMDDFLLKINKEGALGSKGDSKKIAGWMKDKAPLERQLEALHNGERDKAKLATLAKP